MASAGTPGRSTRGCASAPTSICDATCRKPIRRLVDADGRLAIITLLNFRDRSSAEVSSKEAVRLRSLDTGRTFDIPAGGKVEIPMDAHSADFFSVGPLNPGE